MLRNVGLLAWAMVGGWLLAAEAKVMPGRTGYPVNVWVLIHLAFGSSYWFASLYSARPRRIAVTRAVSLALVACSAGVSYYSETGLGGILLMVISSVLPWLMSMRAAVLLIAAANLATTAVLLLPPIHMPLLSAAMQLLIYAGFSAFMLAGSWVAMQQTSAREEQDRINAELLTTRLLLDQCALASERTRISRDVHDLLGHHLTALILNLDVAGRLAIGKTKGHVEQSLSLARLLLADVREVVSKLRANGAIDLREAICQVLDAYPDLASVIDFRTPVPLDDSGSVVILWCVREVIASAVVEFNIRDIRVAAWHGGATINVQISSDDGGLSALLGGEHLVDVQGLLLQHGGSIRADCDRGDLILKVVRHTYPA